MELKTQNLDYENQKSEVESQNLEFTNLNSGPKIQKSELLKRSCSELCSQVVNCEDRSSSCPHAPEGCGCESRRSCYSEEGVDCLLQVDNGSEGDDGFLQREGSQRRSRRRFRRVNPRGERGTHHRRPRTRRLQHGRSNTINSSGG
ncbi:rap guanine nucleotide exchange factor 6 isoform X1 [Lates japonicus]|uniref:Rap guanine nucleotide exchange factor 6 isoform X1 n=1 Tax=Lates japonicus TaxID=270547 RepID=A0AAD3NM42_LATJO|nr:rap guanine nucleotide exchange factor 6 isoform X1 [Lates japonicus]